MSVRQQRRRDPTTGKETMFWIADFTVQVPGGERKRFREVPKIQTRRGAETYERQRIAEVLSGREKEEKGREEKGQEQAKAAAKAECTTVASFATTFIETYAVPNNKPSEVQSKRMILDLHLVPALGGMRLDEVGPGEIERYKAEKLRDGLSPKTVNNHLIVLRRMLAVAEEWGLTKHTPRVRWLKVADSEFDFLTYEESRSLLAAAEGDWRTMILVAAKVGLRQGELLALRWRDVESWCGQGHREAFGLGGDRRHDERMAGTRDRSLTGDSRCAQSAPASAGRVGLLQRRRQYVDEKSVQATSLRCEQEGRAAPDRMARAATHFR